MVFGTGIGGREGFGDGKTTIEISREGWAGVVSGAFGVVFLWS